MDISKDKINQADFSIPEIDGKIPVNRDYYFIILPLLVLAFSVYGILSGNYFDESQETGRTHFEIKGKEVKNAGKYNILSSEDLSGKIKDTVYTDKECWLELKINEQTLYQHWRDGRTVKYPISSGNNKGGDPEALESRPGLFTIFLKVEHHQSSQFNASNMYHFMPFNQGIGFHSIDGTGYYAHLGVRPSSHGCIRMKHDDAKKLFGECPLGTLVLATKGYSARTVAFAPEDFKNEREYSKDEYKVMLASNLYNLIQGKYYLEEKNRFIVDPKVIPVSGVYTSYDVQIPDKQVIPRSYITFYESTDKLYLKDKKEILKDESSEEFIKLVGSEMPEVNNDQSSKTVISSTGDLVKKYFNNPIGVLPYFGPK
ncbi:MAG: L,D-transpeptidase [Ignavibacteria bacterium]|nr:L,D-transpeptidase [Ignavibacteria bacterium]